MAQVFRGTVQSLSADKQRGQETKSFDVRISREDNQAYILGSNVQGPIELGDPVTFELDKTGRAVHVQVHR